MTTREDQLNGKENWESSDRRLYLQRCVRCGVENYSLCVADGVCYFCGWSVKNKATWEDAPVDAEASWCNGSTSPCHGGGSGSKPDEVVMGFKFNDKVVVMGDPNGDK